jgi:hypothetical protein
VTSSSVEKKWRRRNSPSVITGRPTRSWWEIASSMAVSSMALRSLAVASS